MHSSYCLLYAFNILPCTPIHCITLCMCSLHYMMYAFLILPSVCIQYIALYTHSLYYVVYVFLTLHNVCIHFIHAFIMSYFVIIHCIIFYTNSYFPFFQFNLFPLSINQLTPPFFSVIKILYKTLTGHSRLKYFRVSHS